MFVSKTSLRHVFKTFSRGLQRNNFSSSKTSFFVFEDVFKTSWKTKNCYGEGVLKTSSRPTNICWVSVINKLCIFPFKSSINFSFPFTVFHKTLHCTILLKVLPFLKQSSTSSVIAVSMSTFSAFRKRLYQFSSAILSISVTLLSPSSLISPNYSITY